MNITQKQSSLIGGFALVLLVNVSASPAFAETQPSGTSKIYPSTLGSSSPSSEMMNEQWILLQNRPKRTEQCYDSGLC